jgi:hypothetical protein
MILMCRERRKYFYHEFLVAGNADGNCFVVCLHCATPKFIHHPSAMEIVQKLLELKVL